MGTLDSPEWTHLRQAAIRRFQAVRRSEPVPGPPYFWLGAEADREFCRMAGEALGLPRNEFLEDDPSDGFWRSPLTGEIFNWPSELIRQARVAAKRGMDE